MQLPISLCQKNLTPLQRRTVQRLGGVAILMVITNFWTPRSVNPLVDIFPALSRLTASGQHPSALVVTLISALSVLPVLLAVWVVGRYLNAEPDEFIRALVVRALLWGFAVTMAGDAVLGALTVLYPGPFPLAVFNLDLFFSSTGIAFRLALRSYR
jgi:hypothetical protein